MADYIVAGAIEKVARAIDKFADAATRYVKLQEQLASRPIPQYQFVTDQGDIRNV